MVQSNGSKLIDVRKLVALDIALPWPKIIIAEFIVAPPTIIAVGLWLIFINAFLLGLYLLLTGINYIPLLIYAVVIAKAKTAQREVEYGLEHYEH